MIPERSRRSTKIIPPLFLAFCTHPIRVTSLPIISFRHFCTSACSVQAFHALSHVYCSSCLLSLFLEKLNKLCISFSCHLFLLEFFIFLHNGNINLNTVFALFFCLSSEISARSLSAGIFFSIRYAFFAPCLRNLISSFKKQHNDSLESDRKSAGRSIAVL